MPGSTSQRFARATEDEGAIRINRYFIEHPEMVLGTHALASGPYGEAYTCLPRAGTDLGEALAAAVLRLPECVYDGEPEAVGPGHAEPAVDGRGDERRVSIREGSYFIGANGALVQMVDGEAVTIKIRKGRSTDGIFEKHARIIRKLIPIRDAVREILKCQETDQSWKQPQVRLRIAWSSFVRDFGPINTTVCRRSRTRRPARIGKHTAGRTLPPSPTTPIAGWSPRSRTTTSRAIPRSRGRSSPSG